MCLAVIVVYWPTPEVAGDNMLRGGDFLMVHSRRIAFARESFSTRGTLPAWYPREAFGSPFWANIQNFPFIPTRIFLLIVPPQHVFLVGVMLAALLSAVFTFLFARAIGLGLIAAASAGWTFACAGFFASRVTTGELPLLEAYPSLPLLLWLVEINLKSAATVAAAKAVDAAAASGGARHQLMLIGLAAGAMCVALAGHPQLGVYAFAVAGLYLVWRGWGLWRGLITTGVAIALGVAGAAFALWPAMSLVARSTRALSLERGETDIVYPYGRLAAWLFPWKDGWPQDVLPLGANPFHNFPGDAYFYDTVTYLGWLPLVAAAVLALRMAARRARPTRLGIFLTAAGVLALLTALPLAHRTGGVMSFTFLRSPSRQIYVTTFALSVALGMAVDVLLGCLAHGGARTSHSKTGAAMLLPLVTVLAGLAAHAYDLGRHDRRFIRTTFVPPDPHTEIEDKLRPIVGSNRTAIDVEVSAMFNRRFDDVGFFDSIILARPYRTLMDLLGAPPTFNTQNVNASAMKIDRLAEAGVRMVGTPEPRMDLKAIGQSGAATLYRVPNPVGRAMFLPASSAVYINDPEEMHRRRRTKQFDPWAEVMLPSTASTSIEAMKAMPSPETMPTTNPANAPTAQSASAAVMAATPAMPFARAASTSPAPTARRMRGPTLPAALTSAEYERPNSDEIVVHLHGKPAGVLRVLESFDPGWEAELNNRPAEILRADDTFLAVALPPGDNVVRFAYHTPGATAGRVMSVIALAGLFGLLWAVRPQAAITIEDEDDEDEEDASETSEPVEPQRDV